MEPKVGDPDVKKEAAEEMESAELSLMSLPDEMLLKIMDTLSSTDRASCRLVSRDLYAACAFYERKEKMCITGLYHDCLDEVWSTLSMSARSFLHLELRNLNLLSDRETEIAFWKARGSKILSVKLSSCRAIGRTFVNILRHCPNLQTLEFHFPSMEEMMGEDGLSIICLRECVRLHLRNESLRTLNIHFKDKYEPLQMPIEDGWSIYYLEALCQFFCLFRNISNFSSIQRDAISYCDNFRGNPWRTEGKTRNYIARLSEYFAQDQMESIAIPWLGLEWNEWSTFMRDLGTKTTKITEIIISDAENLSSKSFSEYLSRQKNLRKVTCVFTKRSYADEEFEEAANQFITLLHQNVPSVRYLWLVSYIFFRWKGNWSKLQPARATTADVLPITNSSNKLFPILENLTSCKIEVSGLLNFGAVASILRSFPNVKDLYVGRANNAILKSISVNQLKLETLVVDYVDENDPLASTNLIDQFRNLKCLDVPQTLELRPLRLNKLEFVRIVRRNRPPRWTFPKFPSAMILLSSRCKVDLLMLDQYLLSYQTSCAYLEVACFELDCICVVNDNASVEMRSRNDKRARIVLVLADFVANMKHLKYLYLVASNRRLPSDRRSCNSDWTKEDVSMIFQQSRSLRVLVIAEDQIYFRHAIKNCITRKTMRDVDIRATEYLELFAMGDRKIAF